MTRLTIAIPNYNGGKNLKRAIISCQNITIPIQEYEIIVVDNCSTDNSLNIVNELKNEFKREYYSYLSQITHPVGIQSSIPDRITIRKIYEEKRINTLKDFFEKISKHLFPKKI